MQRSFHNKLSEALGDRIDQGYHALSRWVEQYPSVFIDICSRKPYTSWQPESNLPPWLKKIIKTFKISPIPAYMVNKSSASLDDRALRAVFDELGTSLHPPSFLLNALANHAPRLYGLDKGKWAEILQLVQPMHLMDFFADTSRNVRAITTGLWLLETFPDYPWEKVYYEMYDHKYTCSPEFQDFIQDRGHNLEADEI